MNTHRLKTYFSHVLRWTSWRPASLWGKRRSRRRKLNPLFMVKQWKHICNGNYFYFLKFIFNTFSHYLPFLRHTSAHADSRPQCGRPSAAGLRLRVHSSARLPTGSSGPARFRLRHVRTLPVSRSSLFLLPLGSVQQSPWISLPQSSTGPTLTLCSQRGIWANVILLLHLF